MAKTCPKKYTQVLSNSGAPFGLLYFFWETNEKPKPIYKVSPFKHKAKPGQIPSPKMAPWLCCLFPRNQRKLVLYGGPPLETNFPLKPNGLHCPFCPGETKNSNKQKRTARCADLRAASFPSKSLRGRSRLRPSPAPGGRGPVAGAHRSSA